MSVQQKRQSRTKLKVDTKSLSLMFRRFAAGSRLQSYNDIIRTVKECVYVVKGMEKRPLTDREASQFIKDGTITVK